MKDELRKSLNAPVELLREIFVRLSMKRTEFLLSDPASSEELDSYMEEYDVFDADIEDLRFKSDISKFPIFKTFLETHTSSRHYSFHVFKCEDDTCIFHGRIRGTAPERFPDVVPAADLESGYIEGEDPREQYLPSKLLDISKQCHNIPFNPTAQTAKNVGILLNCTECRKPRLVYAQHKLTEKERNGFKRVMNDLLYVFGGSLSDIGDQEKDANVSVINKLFVRENIACSSVIETPYYSAEIFEEICVYCGSNKMLVKSVESYPKCKECSEKGDVLRKKQKTFVQKGGVAKRQKKST